LRVLSSRLIAVIIFQFLASQSSFLASSFNSSSIDKLLDLDDSEVPAAFRVAADAAVSVEVADALCFSITFCIVFHSFSSQS
jgi:hypothetical protein